MGDYVMANSKVALLRYVKIAGAWRRVRVEAVRRGRGWDERLDAPEGAEILERGQFQLRWYQGSRAIYKGVGHDLQEAITARDNQNFQPRGGTCSYCRRPSAGA